MKVVAVTSCATGIAHTYMAAQAIKNLCKNKGYSCKVETQGAMGIEDRLTGQEIKEADIIIFANDVTIQDKERFSAYDSKIIHTSPHEVIKKPESIFEEE